MVPPYSIRISRVPTYSSDLLITYFRLPGFHRLWLHFPEHSTNTLQAYGHWAFPRSLATTNRISVDFFSSGYLDVSVPRVRSTRLCIQRAVTHLRETGFPIRILPGHSLFANSPTLFAGYHVLLRLLLPRHPPYALFFLTI